MATKKYYIVLKGSREYIYRMYKHLLKEHRSVKGKIFIKIKK